MSYQPWAEGDEAPWAKFNENMASLGQGFVFAERQDGHSGLTVGYHGGPFDVNTVADGTVAALTDDTTNYLVVHRSTRAVTSSTATTNWNDTSVYGRMARAVFASGVLTWHDERHSVGGIFDGSAAKAPLASPTFTGTPAAPTAGAGTNTTQIATTAFVAAAVAAAVAGLSWKQAVRAATTAAVTLASDLENGDAIDGVTLATGDRVLVKNQSSATENGIYVVAASGAPTRATDADSGAELVNASVYVSEGTTLADTQWTCTTNAPITVGVTSLAFAQLSSGGGGVATDVIWDAAGDLAVGSGANTAAKLTIGTARQMLRVNGSANGLEWVNNTEAIQIACSDEATALTTGAGKVTFRMPYAFTLTDVRASVTTAPTGSTLTVDINEGGSTILSTKLTIDASEKTSTTAATPAVISDASLADDAEITIDIDQVGSTIAGAGLKVTLIGVRAS